MDKTGKTSPQSKKGITYIVGHKNPDTDSICSAIALARLKIAKGETNVRAARAGDVNPQTAYILDRFKVDAPHYLPDVYQRVKEIMTTEIEAVDERSPLLKVIELFRGNNIRFIPVVDESRNPVGILTPMDLAEMNLVRAGDEASRRVFTSIGNIAETLKGEVHCDALGAVEKDFYVYVGAMGEGSFLKVLGEKNASDCIIIVGDRERIQGLSIDKGVGLLIVTGGLEVSPEICEAAKNKGVSLISSPFDSATTALMVRLSAPASRFCKKTFETVGPGELVDDVKLRMAESLERGMLVLGEEGALLGIVTKSNLLKGPKTSLILVDHNELSQSVDGADRVTIREVVDHHRLGNFHTTQPIRFICEPVGSTSTLVAEMYRKEGVSIARDIAGLLLAGVLSDTVMLKSPTSTERDVDIIGWLEEKSGLDHLVFGQEVFSATSSLRKKGINAVIHGDFKIFETKGEKFGVGQVETIGFGEFFEAKARLTAELMKVKETKGLKLSALLVTDIVAGTSLLLATAEKEVVRNLDYPQLEENVYELKGVLSRKKQVAPHLLSLFNSIY